MPEATDDRILRAAEILTRREVAQITLLGQPDRTLARAARLGLHLENVQIIDPLESELYEPLAERFLEEGDARRQLMTRLTRPGGRAITLRTSPCSR